MISTVAGAADASGRFYCLEGYCPAARCDEAPRFCSSLASVARPAGMSGGFFGVGMAWVRGCEVPYQMVVLAVPFCSCE